jgi:putative MATE family efflux protein
MEHTDRMGTGSIPKLLMHFAAPAITGLVAHALYNIIDRIFVGHVVGHMGIAAITVAFPFMITLMSLGILVGVGSSSLISIFLGEKRKDKAEKVLGNALTLLILGSVFMIITGFLFGEKILLLSGASQNIIPHALKYMNIIIWGVPFALMSFGFNYFIRAEGHPRYAMFTLIFGAILNTILDAVFILHFSMGLKGAALATVLSQLASALWVILFYINSKGALRITRKNMLLKGEITRRIIAIGFPPFLLEMTFVIVLSLLNKVIRSYGGDLAISAVGIFFSLDSLLFLPVIGIGEGVQPLIGYNYGSGDHHRVVHAIKLAMLWAFGFFFLSFSVIMLFPEPLVSLFNRDNVELMEMTVRGMRIAYLALPLLSVTIITGSTLQAMGKARISLALNLTRQIVLWIPLLVLLPRVFGLDGVWMSIPVSDGLGAILSSFILRSQIRQLLNHRITLEND